MTPKLPQSTVDILDATPRRYIEDYLDKRRAKDVAPSVELGDERQ